jgi:predicted nucleotidyltransferase
VEPIKMIDGLSRAGVRFVIIGGVAAIVHGSVRRTDDLDICYDPTADNVERLVALLHRWHAHLRVPDGSGSQLPFVIDARTFRDAPNLTLDTDLGWFDLLGEVAGIGECAEALAASQVEHLGGVELRVLTLDALILAKQTANRGRDRDHLIELEAIRALKQLQATAPPTRSRPKRSR